MGSLRRWTYVKNLARSAEISAPTQEILGLLSSQGLRETTTNPKSELCRFQFASRPFKRTVCSVCSKYPNFLSQHLVVHAKMNALSTYRMPPSFMCANCFRRFSQPARSRRQLSSSAQMMVDSSRKSMADNGRGGKLGIIHLYSVCDRSAKTD